MPFSLRSDEELIAEARRALEALGVEVVIDSTSSSLEECVQRHELDLSSSKVAILTSRAAVEESAPSEPVEMCAAFLATLVYIPDLGVLSCLRTMLWRTLEQVDVAAGIVAWWRRMHADPGWRGTGFTCCRCRKRHPAPMTPHACQQCQADICARCMQQLSLHRCTVCRAWCVGPTLDGVPWDMPRPAPTRREAIAATAAAPSTTSALPQRMAAATGSDGWLRLPPQHQRMHPVDVLVDGVLAALDGCVSVRPSTRDTCPAPKDDVAFTRLPLSDTILEGVTLDSVRRRLKQAVDGLMPQVSAAPVQEVLLAVSTLRQVVLVGAGIAGFFSREQNVSWTSCHAAVYRKVARVHPVADRPEVQVSLFTVRKRERATSAAPTPSATASQAHEWELVQLSPGVFYMSNDASEKEHVGQVAYLRPERLGLPPAVRRVLRDAHARLGGTACGAKQVDFLPLSSQSKLGPCVTLGGAGRVVGMRSFGEVEYNVAVTLRQACMAGEPVIAFCRDLEAFLRALPGLPPSGHEAVVLEVCVWGLEGLAWRERQWGMECVGRWGERRGGAGRKGRRRREPGVVFELGPWGEERRALSHEEAAWVLVQVAGL